LPRPPTSETVIVDYLQKLRLPGKPEHRYLAVTQAAAQLAKLAKEEDLAVLLLSSLTERNGKGRNDAPSLSHIRQSGDVQYESHSVLLLHRRVDEETEKPEEQGEIIVAKARSDEQGCVRIRFNSSFLRFEDASGLKTREVTS
jgi:replicative DNA helicase